MAFLIPEGLRSRKDVPESIRRVAGALQTALDDDVTVWFEPLFDPMKERPHLVVLEPRIGVVVIEVLKGESKSTLLGALRGRLCIELDGTEEEVDSPLLRAETLAASLRAAAAGRPVVRHAPFVSVAVFSRIDRDEAERLGVGKVVDLDRCVFKPDLDSAINDGNAAALLRVFQRTAGPSLDGELDAVAQDELRGLIHPDVVIGGRPHQGALFSAATLDGDTIKVMDRKQESMAKNLGSGHRVIRGVAGSGKTLVLVHRARLLSRYLPGHKILVTCYTRSLASQLRAELADCRNVEVRNLDKLMAAAVNDANMEFPAFAKLPAAAVKAQAQNPNSPKFRAVLVDEAQDFDTEALQFCVNLLESTDPDEQDLIIVADSAQNIFRKKFRWKDAGIRAQGRTRLLRVNYRNTREILAFAHAFLTAGGSIDVQETPDPEDELSVIPAESSERSGRPPVVIAASSGSDEVARVIDAVKVHYGERSASRSIAVLYGGRSDGNGSFGAELAAALTRANLPFFWVNDPAMPDNKDLAGEADSPILLSTIQSSKGLEFSAVVACGLGVRDDLITARKLIYVGFTRAINDLTVIVGKDSPFRDDLLPTTALA